MKKKLSLLFLICILSALNINAAVTEGVCGDNVNYSFDSFSGVLRIYGTGAMSNYEQNNPAPWSRQYIKSIEIADGVTSIGDCAFNVCTDVTSVIIPNSVASIGNYAFNYCKNLTSIDIPNSVTSIGNGTFSNCSSLKSITIPNKVTSLGNGIFSGCSILTSVIIPNSVTSIGICAFSGCSRLVFVTIPTSVTLIGDEAFYNCSGLTSIEIPNSVTSIGESAFCGCSNLTSITIPNNVTSIRSRTFENCTSLTSIKIPNSVTSIGSSTFSGCSSLTSIEIPNSVTSIEGYAFYGCSGLTSVTIGNSVTSIGNWAFYGCSGLTSITIPNSVTSIGKQAFYGCSGLTSVTIPNSVTSIGSSAFTGCYFEKNDFINNSSLDAEANNYWGATIVEDRSLGYYVEDGVLTRYYGNQETFIVPNDIKSIGSNAFSGCSNLTSVTIPNSVISIGNSVFSGCHNLTKVTLNNNAIISKSYSSNSTIGSIFGNQVKQFVIGDNVTSIGDYAFYNCSGLTSITIPNSVTSIGNSAFYSCSSLTTIEIPNSVTSIGINAFYNCSSLTSVEIPNSVTSIGNYAFSSCSSLTSVEIPNSVTSIGINAFYECPNLIKVVLNSNAIASKSKYSSSNSLQYTFGSQVKEYIIGNDVTEIGDYIFSYCSNLTSIVIPDNVTWIGNCAFSGCSNLTSITIGKGVDIAGDVFRECTCLTKVIISSYVSSSYKNSDCPLKNKFGNQIEEYIIGEDVTSIGSYVFSGCPNLTSITIPNRVTTIEDYGFANIPKLEKIYCYAENVPVASRNAFENSYVDYVTLYVPASSVDAYKSTAPWKNAAQILPLEDYKEKCATPTIIFENGKLSFSSETEGARFVCNFSTPSESYEEGAAVSMPNKLQVSVYAKKDGFENSDVATKEIDLGTSGLRGDVNNDGTVNMPDAMFIVNKILNGKFPDEDLELEKAGVRFGFYEEVPGYSVKIDKINVEGLRVAEFGSVGTTLKESNSDITFDKTDGSYTNVYFKDANENPQMVVEVDYTLTSDDGTGETFTGKTITNIGLQNITQWKPNKNYTFIFKVVPTYLYGGIIDVEHPSIYFESVNVEGSGGMTR